MKRILSVFLALILMISVTGMTAAAATVEKADRINIHASMKTLRVKRTVQLDFKVYPKDLIYDNYEWYSENDDIAEVDEYGEVTGVSPGEVQIALRIFGKDSNGKRVRLGTGYIDLKVVSSVVSSEPEMPKPNYPGSGDSSDKDDFSGGKVSAAAINSAVKKAVEKGKTTSSKFKDAGSVSAASLQSAAIAMKNGGGVVLLNFDTTNGTGIEGRLTINPADADGAKGDIKLGVYTTTKEVVNLKEWLEGKFKNRLAVVKAAQSGSFGMNVSYAVKFGTLVVREKDLRVYSYDRDTGKYNEIKDANIRFDTSGYAHFTSTLGGWHIISDGELKAR